MGGGCVAFGGGVGLVGGQGGSARIIEFFVKIQKKNNFLRGRSGQVGGRVGGGGGGGVRVDVNEEFNP